MVSRALSFVMNSQHLSTMDLFHNLLQLSILALSTLGVWGPITFLVEVLIVLFYLLIPRKSFVFGASLSLDIELDIKCLDHI